MRDPDYRPRWPSRDMRVPVPEGDASFDVDLGAARVRILGLPTSYDPFVAEHYEPFSTPLEALDATGPAIRCRAGQGMVLPFPGEGGVTRLDIVRRGHEIGVRSHFVDARIDIASGAGELLVTDLTWDRFAHSLENVLRVTAQAHALGRKELFLHAAAVLDEGRAVLFAAPSGVGKSTAVGLSLPRVAVTDDLALVDLQGETPHLVATPFHPAEPPELRRRGRWPIAAVLRLRQADEDRLVRLSPARAAASLGTLVPYAADLGVGADRLTPLVARLVARAPVFDAYFTRSPRFWKLLAESL